MLYRVREVRRDDPEDASQLAALWNVSDVNWPGGGLLHGVPMTAERMREQLRRDGLLVLVAEVDGRIIGYLGLKEVPGREDVAHGTTLTVHPDWLGRGCGKTLLLAALDRVREMGYRQYRGATWSGNLKAIPLYKKIGDFWEPGTSVRLQNFIPTALTLPIARGFFERHDWYRSLRRDLSIAPDEFRWRGVRVYPYHFEAEDEFFVMVVDRQAEAPTAIETNEIFVSSHLGREEVLCGLPQTVTWEVSNRRADGRPMRVELVAEGPSGTGLTFAETFEVTDSLRLERSFVVPPSLERPKPGAPQHAIRSRLLLDGVPVTLSTGFRTADPIAIEVQGLELAPGKPDEEATVRLHNRLKTALTAEVTLEPAPGLAFERLSAPVSLPAGSWGSCRFHVTAADGAHGCRVRAVCPPGRNAALGLDAPLETRAKTFLFRTIPLDRVYAWEDEGSEWIGIEAPSFWMRVYLRGGGFSIHERLSGQKILDQAPLAVGPSFDRQAEVPLCGRRIETAEGRLRLALEIPTESGLVVERTLTVNAGPFLRLDHRVRNPTGIDQRPQLRCNGEIHLHRAVTVPLVGGLVHEIVEGLGDFPLAGGADLPRDPAAYAEGWTAREEHGVVAGLVWKTCGEIDGASIRIDPPAIPPGESVDADPLHLVVSRGDWEVVRDLWRRLWQAGGAREERRPAAHPVLSAGFEPGPLLVNAERTPASLAVRNRRLKPFEGRWELRAEGLQCEPAAGELPAVTPEAPAVRDLALVCPDLTPRVVPAAVILRSATTVEERETPVVVLGDADREVTVESLADGARYGVDNGRLRFVVAPAHHGSMISLESQGRELLVSSFPEPRPYQWATAWFGGVEPYLQQPGDVRHVRDVFTGEPVERRGARGLIWRGVRVTRQVRPPEMRWLALAVEYLTTGASDLIVLVMRAGNRGGVAREVPLGFMAFPAVTPETRVRYDVRRPGYRPGGSTAERGVVLRERAPASPGFRFGDAEWVAMETRGSLLSLISFPPPGEAGGWLLDRENAGLHTGSRLRLEPGETREALAWLALAAGPEQARGYRVLSLLEELP